jgi:membrane associated rhomboid family serine protease
MTVSSGPGADGGRRRRASAEIDVEEARKAFFLMVGFIGLIWVLQVVNWTDHYHLDQSYGIAPRSLGHLADIFTAPFLHYSWNHIEGNSGPLFVFGLLAAYRGVRRFFGVTLLVAVTSGLAVWLFQGTGQLTVGASGLIFGYFGYVLARGIFDRNLIDALAAVVMALSYAYILTVAIPGTPGVSWLGHLGGLIGGLAAGWVFRAKRRARVKTETLTPGSAGTAVVSASRDNPRTDLHKELDDLGL